MANKETPGAGSPVSPTADEIRVTATYKRNDQTALTRTQFFDATTDLQELLRWAREAEDMGITLTSLEIEVKA